MDGWMDRWISQAPQSQYVPLEQRAMLVILYTCHRYFGLAGLQCIGFYYSRIIHCSPLYLLVNCFMLFFIIFFSALAGLLSARLLLWWCLWSPSATASGAVAATERGEVSMS